MSLFSQLLLFNAMLINDENGEKTFLVKRGTNVIDTGPGNYFQNTP